MKRIFSVIILSLLSYTLAFSQPIHSLRCLDFNQILPKNLLSSKVLVMVSIDHHDSITDVQGNYKAYIKNAQKYFSKIGIETTDYYSLDEVFSSTSMANTYFKKASSRNVDYICLLSHRHSAGMDTESLRITPFNKKNTFISHGQEAYAIKNQDFYQLVVTLAKAVKASGQTPANFLIEERPNIISGAPLESGEKSYVFNSDLKVSKLAIRQFEKIELPEQLPANAVSKEIKAKIEKYNTEVPANNQKLKNIMSRYPYPYEVVDDSETERALFDLGYQFMLKSITTKERILRKILECPKEISTKNKLVEPEDVVTKFYAKQLFSKDLYFGDQWEVNTSWEVSLKAHIDFLIKYAAK